MDKFVKGVTYKFDSPYEGGYLILKVTEVDLNIELIRYDLLYGCGELLETEIYDKTYYFSINSSMAEGCKEIELTPLFEVLYIDETY